MITDHLNDKTTYNMTESSCDAKVMKGIAKIIEKYKDNLTRKKKNILYSQTCIRWPLLGPLKSGCLGQVVIL